MPNNLISAELSQQLIKDDCKSFNIRKDDGWKEFVAIVRCKDCKFYWKNDRDSNGVVCLATPKDDAYCSEGERREDVNIS